MAKFGGSNLEFVREDDYVEYYLFPQLPEHIATSLSTAGPVPETYLDEVRQHLTTVLKQCNEIIETIVNKRSHIWHKDGFHLQIRTGSAQENILNDEQPSNNAGDRDTIWLPPHLHGVTHYGDNMDDEWFIVHLLGELTRKLTGCIARVIDSDGEFLLIEAADVLPHWANPDTCEQRVYIADGVMHLVQNSPSNTAKLMPVHTAITRIHQNPTLYRVSKDIQACIEERTKQFQTSTNDSLHHQIVRLPLGVASLLKHRPELIASAVRAFCERDSGDLKACRTMRFFPPEQRVRTNVRFTRCLYAMVMHSNYVPDRKIGWNLSGQPNTEEYKEDLLGVKIASGFEILATQAKKTNNQFDEENAPAWRAYVRSLTAKGYFRDNLEGSADYKRLLDESRTYYKANNERFRTAPLVGRDILDLLQNGEINAEQLRDDENNLQPSDSDDWLNITADQLDAMLLERYGPKKLYKPNGDINAAEFTKNLTEFLEKQSEFDGIHDSDDDDDDGNGANDANESFQSKLKKNHSMRRACKQNSTINEKPSSASSTSKAASAAAQGDDDGGSFSTHVRNFLDFVIPEDNWDSNSEMSDYEDEDDLERNFEAMSNAEKNIDGDIKAYMAQMDRELAKTTIGQSFESATKTTKATTAVEDDFDDIEDFEPININVNTLKNMMDSYKSQIGGAGPVSNLLNAMGVGMSASNAPNDDPKDLTESSV